MTGIPPGDLEPWQEPVRGGPADPAAFRLTGRAQLRGLRDGLLRTPSSARLTGRLLTQIGRRSVTFTMPASPWLAGPKGIIHPGVLVLLGDSALTGAVLTALPPGVLFSTAELSMTFLAEMPSPGGELTAQASVLHSSGRHGLAVAELRGPVGELLGFGTSRVFLQPPMDVSGLPRLEPPAPEPDWATHDPWARPIVPPPAVVVPAATHGLEVLAKAAHGEQPRPPIDRLLGIRVTRVDRGAITFSKPASDWLTNELGMVSGGCLGLLAESATSAAGQSLARPGSGYRALDVKINFLAQVPPDGGDIVAQSRAIHQGKLMVATTEVVHQGKLVAVATGSTVLGD